jgi:predicted RNase H-like HicB family nuclease
MQKTTSQQRRAKRVEGETAHRKDATFYSNLDYPVDLVRDDGVYVASNPDLPGCVSMGSSPNEAVQSLDEVRLLWIEGQLANGSPIPEPSQAEEYSGKFVLRVPKGLHRLADRRARQEGVSLNSFITSLFAGALGYPLHEAERSLQGRQGGAIEASLHEHSLWASQEWEIAMANASKPSEEQVSGYELAGFIVAVAKQIGSHNKSPFKLGECEDYSAEKEIHATSR